MKKLALAVLTATTLFLTTKTTAQEVKSQSDYIKTLKPGRYKIKASHYSYRGEMNIASVSNDRSKPAGNYKVHLEMFPNKEKKGDRKNRRYFRDNLAFPATYVWNSYTGMEKVQKRAGYVLDKGRDIGDERLIVLDDYIFIIQDWKSKDKYYGITALERTKAAKSSKKGKKKKKKKKSKLGMFFKTLKEGYKEASTGGGEKMVEKLKKEVLQPYLDKAFAKQEIEKKKSKFIALQKQEDALREKVRKADRDYVKFYNDSLSNTPEYRKIDAHRALLKKGSVTVYNKSGKDLWVGHRSPSFISHHLPDGASYQLQHCKDPIYYYYHEGTERQGYKVCDGNTHCGGSVTIR